MFDYVNLIIYKNIKFIIMIYFILGRNNFNKRVNNEFL